MAEEDGTREMKAGVAASCSDEDRGSKFFGDSVQDRYHIGRILGEGAFSVVRKAKRRVDGYVCALKVIDKKESGSTDLKNEIEILCKVNHPNCVAFYEWTETKSKVVLSMELVTGGSLLDEILTSGCYAEQDSRIIFKQIACALQYLHKQGIVHRDLKPENVMLASKDSRTRVKLTDFGLSKILDTQDPVMFSTVCGTPQYIPPEVLNVFDGKTEGYEGKNMDMYGLGTLLYILLSGTVPFHDKDEMELFIKIKNGTWDFYDAIWKSISDEAKGVTAALMEVDPRKRMTLEEALEHPWADAPLEAQKPKEESPSKDDKDLFPQISNLRVSTTGHSSSSP